LNTWHTFVVAGMVIAVDHRAPNASEQRTCTCAPHSGQTCCALKDCMGYWQAGFTTLWHGIDDSDEVLERMVMIGNDGCVWWWYPRGLFGHSNMQQNFATQLCRGTRRVPKLRL
jgi:hypothetical protein